MEKQFLHVGGGQLLDVDGVGVGERLVDAGRERHAHVPQQEDGGVVHQRARNRRRPGSEEEVDFYFIVEFQVRMIFSFFSFLRSFLCPQNLNKVLQIGKIAEREMTVHRSITTPLHPIGRH